MTPLASITFAGKTVLLLRTPPAANSGNDAFFTAAFTLPVNIDVSLDQREERRPLAQYFRISGSYKFLLKRGTELGAWRAIRQGQLSAPFLLPFWPAAGITKTVSSPYWAKVVPNADGSDYTYIIYADGSLSSSPTLTAGALIVPVLLVRLSAVPEVDLYDPTIAVVKLQWDTDGESTWITPFTASFSSGPSIATIGATQSFPWRANWSEKPIGADPTLQLTRKFYGSRRESAVQFFNQPALRALQQSYTTGGAKDWRTLLAFVLQYPASAVWVDASINETQLSADAASTDTTLTVADVSQLINQPALVIDDGFASRLLLAADTTSNPITLSDAIGRDYAAGSAVRAAVLVRLAQAAIELSWINVSVATAQLKWIELGWEQTGASGDTIGATMGNLGTTATLFQFTLGSSNWYYTNFEASISSGGHTYNPAHIEYDTIKETLNFEDISTNIRGRWDASGPFASAWPFRLEAPLQVIITEAVVSSGATTSTQVLFRGEAETLKLSGPLFEAKCSTLANLLDRSIPARTKAKTCPWVFCSADCGLNRTDLQVNATVVTGGTDVTSIVVASSGTAWTSGTFAVHRFANGDLQRTSGNPVSRVIQDSTIVDGSHHMTLTVAVPVTLAAGDTLTLLPGCDQQYTTCEGYSNTAHFGGAPFIPPANLLQYQPPIQNPNGKK